MVYIGAASLMVMEMRQSMPMMLAAVLLRYQQEPKAWWHLKEKTENIACL